LRTNWQYQTHTSLIAVMIIIQGGPKTGPVRALITQRWLPVERRVICQIFIML